MPKLYFYDTSLACNLLRITSTDDVYDHYLRGALFESMILSDLLKKRFHRGLPPNLYFWRDKSGLEVDGLLEEGSRIRAFEIKASATIQNDFFENIGKWSKIAAIPTNENTIIYAGTEEQKRSQGHVVPWQLL